MLYDKPRSFSWRVRPSFSSSLKPQRVKKAKSVKQANENLINEARFQKPAFTPAPPPVKQEDVDIILKGKATFTEELIVSDGTIIDINEMPVIDGIPMLILPKFPKEEKKEDGKPVTLPEPKKEKQKKEKVKKEKSEKPKKEKIKKVKEKKERVKKEKVKKEIVAGRKTHISKAASFFILLYAGAILSFIIPLRPTYSDSEKRELTKFPEFSVESLASGEYFSEISTWFSDTFPFREQLLELNSSVKNFYGFENVAIHGDIDQSDDIPDAPVKVPEVTVPETTEPPKMPTDDELKENNGDPDAQKPDYKAQKLGAVIVADDSAYEYYAFSQSLAPRFIAAVDKIPDKIKTKNGVHALINPTSIDIKLNDALRADVKSANQEKALNYFNGSLKKTIAVETIYSAQREHREEYTYFRTDHHWTALGAYYSYREYCLKNNITPTPLSAYQTKTFGGFKGTFYAGTKQNKNLGENPDSITAYLPVNNAEMTVYRADGRSFNWPIINDVSDYNAPSKYSTFIAGDNALTVIKNLDNTEGKTCVVIKDSYGNAFIPFLIPHYSMVYVIDPRHYEKSLSEFAQDKVFDDVLFVCNISVTRNDVFISALENLLR